MPRTVTLFDVRLHFRFPAWDEKNGILFADIPAARKSDAVKRARRQAYDAGHTVGLKVTQYWFTVEKIHAIETNDTKGL